MDPAAPSGDRRTDGSRRGLAAEALGDGSASTALPVAQSQHHSASGSRATVARLPSVKKHQIDPSSPELLPNKNGAKLMPAESNGGSQGRGILSRLEGAIKGEASMWNCESKAPIATVCLDNQEIIDRERVERGARGSLQISNSQSRSAARPSRCHLESISASVELQTGVERERRRQRGSTMHEELLGGAPLATATDASDATTNEQITAFGNQFGQIQVAPSDGSSGTESKGVALEVASEAGRKQMEKGIVERTMSLANKKLAKKNRVGYVKAPCQAEPPDQDDAKSLDLSQGAVRASSVETRAAIECRQLRYQVTEINLNDIFNYKQREILHGINLTVPEGSIYGLLGPSGCGKTTMLKCVAGRLHPSSGSVRVFGFEPGESGSQIPGPAIGYMPQELSIYEEFTINETLTYFGMINRIARKVIASRIEFLLKFLDLPNKSRAIRTLSGGQKRRVSLAAALVHSPPLLILDEPTVGVDPLLREIIWNYLVRLAKSDQITIIITTHYIEEARQANIVGLMRHGSLLAEDSPHNLMLAYNVASLEGVFLRLCMEHKEAERDKIREMKGKRDKVVNGSLLNKLDHQNDSEKKLINKSIFTFSRPPESELAMVACDKDNSEQLSVPQIAFKSSSAAQTSASGPSSSGSSLSDFNGPESRNSRDNSRPTCSPSPISCDQVTLMIDEEAAQDNKSLGGEKESPNLEETNGARNNNNVDADVGEKQELIGGPRRQFKSMNKGSKYKPYRTTPLIWLEVLWAVTWKNVLRLKRNPPVILFEFILPAFQVLLFCFCIGGDPFDVPLAVVNEESVPRASLLFLNSINKQTFEQIPFDNLSSALDSVRQGKTWGVVHIPENYTKYLQERLFHPDEANNQTLANGTIRIHPDLTNLHLALAMENTFREAFIKFARDTLELFGYDPRMAELPIKLEKPVYGGLATKPSYLEFMAPGVVVSITYVMATGLTALAFIMEKRDGLLERSQISGVTTSQILLAHVSLQVFVMTFQIALVLLVTFYIFEIPSQGPFYLVVLLILLQGCTGMGFGLVISAICSEENTAVMMLVGTFYINLILAGIIWPIEAMPKWLRWFSFAQPQTLPVESLRNILSRGWDFDEPRVYLGFLVTISWLLVFLIGAGLCMKYFK